MPVLIPAQSGSYALRLRLRLPAPLRLAVGRLGAFDFPAGDYLYMGSARGPGGLRGRLGHHLRVAERPRWHIDYLRQHADALGGWFSLDSGELECIWSQALCCLPEGLIPAPGFGAADCQRGCPAHLLAFPLGLPMEQVLERLRTPDARPVTLLPFLSGGECPGSDPAYPGKIG